MKPNKKIARYVAKHGYEIKNYKQLCTILNEKSTTGEARNNQIRQWLLYFNYEKDGHKFYITDVYDNETVKENEKLFNENKNINTVYSRSRYRKELIPTLLYVLSNSPDSPLIETKMNLATLCGFFNESTKYNTKYGDYIEFRDSKKAIGKIYFCTDMNVSTFYQCLGDIRKNAYNSVERALKSLQDLKLIDYEYINIGQKSDKKYLLSKSEEDIYNECRNEALKELVPFYNEHTKEQKEELKEKDFIYRYDIREEYYNILNKLVSQRLDYDIVLKHYCIYLVRENYEKSIMYKSKLSYEEYKNAVKKINKDFVLSLKANMDNKIRQDEIFWSSFFLSYINPDISLKEINPKEGKLQEIAEQKYYNECELIDLLVSYTPKTNVINLEELKKEHMQKAINELFETGNINDFSYSLFENSDDDFESINKMLKNL